MITHHDITHISSISSSGIIHHHITDLSSTSSVNTHQHITYVSSTSSVNIHKHMTDLSPISSVITHHNITHIYYSTSNVLVHLLYHIFTLAIYYAISHPPPYEKVILLSQKWGFISQHFTSDLFERLNISCCCRPLENIFEVGVDGGWYAFSQNINSKSLSLKLRHRTDQPENMSIPDIYHSTQSNKWHQLQISACLFLCSSNKVTHMSHSLCTWTNVKRTMWAGITLI